MSPLLSHAGVQRRMQQEIYAWDAGLRRRRSAPARVGTVWIGGEHPIVVQSMTNTEAADAQATAKQVAELAAAGSEIVRITVNHEEAAAAVPKIVRLLEDEGINVPVVGDFHYNG